MNENQLELPNGKIITLNDEQFEGLRKIELWLKSRDTFTTLAGFAGTGKSTVVKKSLDGFRRRIAVSACTHKAKKVIINTTGQEGTTLHALLGLRPDLDLDSFNPNDPKFSPIAKPKLDNFDFIVIDEASMVNEGLFELLKFTAEGLRTKILFMGDPAQIPPIGEKESVVFYDKDINIHWLTKVERQIDGNPLLPVYDKLRNNLTLINGGYEKITNINENGEGIIFLNNKMDFRKAVINKFASEDYKKDFDYTKLIAWQNNTVMASNKTIRASLFGKVALCVEVGDVLMGYRSISAKRSYYNIIENSADYLITKRGECEENEYGIWGFRACLRENLGRGQFNYRDVFIIDSYDENNLHYYAEMHDFFKERGKLNKKHWEQYYDYRRENMVMVTIKEYRNGTKRPDSEVIMKDLDYGYAITGHKSQGSTYKHVMILEDDINLNHKIKERNQIKYVALTRPTTTATMLSTDLL